MVSPILAEDVSCIAFSRAMVESQMTRCNGFMDAVERQGVVPFVKLCVEECCQIDNRFVVSPHVAVVPHFDSEAPKGGAEVNDLFDGCASSNKLRSTGCCFNCGLLLGTEIDGCPVDKMETGSDGSASPCIMVRVGIDKVGKLNPISQRL